MTELSPRHQTAREWAEAGIPVFPCRVDAKKPACENGYLDSTTDLAQIDAWWSQADYNVAFSPEMAGWSVLDIDGPEGEATLAKLCEEYGPLPDTLTIRTPRGGRHLYFEGSLPTTAQKLGPKVDTRGVGGYVLIAPSVVGGKPYEEINDRDCAAVPSFIRDRIAAANEQHGAVISELDRPGSVDRAKRLLVDYVERGDVAIDGCAGDDRTYRLACELLNLGLSPEMALTLLEEHWNPHCQPPWDTEELAVKVANASEYAQNEAGAWGVEPAAEAFKGSALDKLVAEAVAVPAQRSRFYFQDVFEQTEAPVARWLVKDLIPDATTILVVGAKGTFKSFLTHDIALSVAAGVPTFGIAPERSGPFFYGAHEGRNELARPRRQAWEEARGLSGKRYPFFLAPAPRIISPDECEQFREGIRERLRQGSARIAGIALDTVAKCMSGLDENSSKDMGLFVEFCDNLVTEFACPVLAVAHTRKDGSKGSRGSGALEAGFGTIIDVERKDKSKDVTVSVRYHKDAEERERPWHLKGRKVGEALVFDPVDLREHFAAIAAADPFEDIKVGACLLSLGARGPENAVPTPILLSELLPHLQDESPDEREAALGRASRNLLALSRSRLEAYCARKGREVVWFLPAAPE